MCSMLIGLWARRSFSFGVLNRINTCGAKQLSWASQIYCSGRVLVPFQVQKLQLREMSSRDLYKPAQRIADQGKNVWVEFTALAQKYKAVNLGQGMPDFAPPQYVREALSKAALSDSVALNQYTRSQGHPRLVNALGSLYSKLLQREVHPMEEILITGGAYESLYCAFHGILDPGDEVILIEPHFDCYVPQVMSAGGIPKFVPLQPTKDATSSKDWVFDKEELEAAFNEKTRMIVLNTPHNPVGKVFTLDELQFIANLCKKHNVICISDEVYEWLVFGKAQHIRIATLPGMWERTITIGSAGKTFSVTGWKLGWSISPAPLIKNLQTVQANVTYTLATPTQEAVAECFEREIPLVGTSESSFKQLSEMLEKKRDHMATLLRDVGFVPTIPEGGYFMMADTSNIDVNFDEYDKSDDSHDYKFVRWLTKEKGIATIPPSAFYSPQHKHFGSNFIRFCFMKEDSTLENAAKKLKEWQEELSK